MRDRFVPNRGFLADSRVRSADALEHIAYRLDDLVELLTPAEPEFRPIPRGESDGPS